MHERNSSRPAPSGQVIYCLYCSQVGKKKLIAEPEKAAEVTVKPAVTFTVVMMGGFPVSIPVCGDHLEVGSNKLVTG